MEYIPMPPTEQMLRYQQQLADLRKMAAEETGINGIAAREVLSRIAETESIMKARFAKLFG